MFQSFFPNGLCAIFFLFLPHFDVICDLLLIRNMATWNLLIILLNGCIQEVAKCERNVTKDGTR